MKQIDFNFYTSLKTKEVSLNKVSKSITSSTSFSNLLGARIIDIVKSGRGSKIVVKKHELYDNFLSVNFPTTEELIPTKSNNIKKYRSSKARRTSIFPVFFIRGFEFISINDEMVNIKDFTTSYGLFGIVQPKIRASKVCFVENKDTFMKAERLLGKEWTYLHSYGRVGVEAIKNIECAEVLVFVDYDFNGLDEFLRIKSEHPDATLYIPNNFDELFGMYSSKLKGKQRASKRVLESNLPEVVSIRELLQKSNKFLEQEVLIND
ncbi:hypothetical protein [Pontibacter vulgaris]|uniref:hypothetical protein n=1 Tax=Pontibacter vulgaris TaxID=2905679 RepID=UPI001FA7EC40|nr:hypothetical protein [Pontibacter vulgaris]